MEQEVIDLESILAKLKGQAYNIMRNKPMMGRNSGILKNIPQTSVENLSRDDRTWM